MPFNAKLLIKSDSSLLSLENGSTLRNLKSALKFKGRGQVFFLFVLSKCNVQTAVRTQYVFVKLNLKKKNHCENGASNYWGKYGTFETWRHLDNYLGKDQILDLCFTPHINYKWTEL